MVQLLDADIMTREVLEYTGVHLFHFWSSSCSQKTRICLNLKGAQWESHEVNLPQNENFKPWFLGINPRGLVPVLVFNGDVHVESNDIITVLDQRLPGPKLIPDGMEALVSELLRHEDDLHLDIRTLTFRFTQPRGREPKSKDALANYRAGGTGTIGGIHDPNKDREIDFWETVAREGITDERVRVSAEKLRTALDALDETLSLNEFLAGEQLTVLDVAWFIYVNRLIRCSYPVARLHPHLEKWFGKLLARPDFSSQITVPEAIQIATEDNHRRQAEAGESFVDVTGF